MSEYRRRRSTRRYDDPAEPASDADSPSGARTGSWREIREQLVVGGECDAVAGVTRETPDTHALAYDPSINADPGCISMSSHRSAAAYVAPLRLSCGFSSVRRWFSFRQKPLSSMRTSGFLRRSMFHVGDSAISHKNRQIWPQQNVRGDRKAQAVAGGCVAGSSGTTQKSSRSARIKSICVVKESEKGQTVLCRTPPPPHPRRAKGAQM